MDGSRAMTLQTFCLLQSYIEHSTYRFPSDEANEVCCADGRGYGCLPTVMKNKSRCRIYRVAVDMKFHIHSHIHIHRFYVDIHGHIHIHVCIVFDQCEAISVSESLFNIKYCISFASTRAFMHLTSFSHFKLNASSLRNTSYKYSDLLSVSVKATLRNRNCKHDDISKIDIEAGDTISNRYIDIDDISKHD